ncbi:MAG: hypothetical protein NWQ55_10445 [Salibacteraceae bacterium]|nr:hypothetical protein [Salibacteraceae bacterium]
MILAIHINVAVFGQCDMLQTMANKIDFEGVYIEYYADGDLVKIKYRFGDFTNLFPNEFDMNCSNQYGPSIWKPTWRNDRFIEFSSGCGTYCFSKVLMPLKVNDSFKYAGQTLIDTANTIYFTLIREERSYDPFLKIENYTTDRVQKIALNSRIVDGAILLEGLDYSEAHPQGFEYENKVLTLFVKTKKEKVKAMRFKVEV